jgi:hypothetical protein
VSRRSSRLARAAFAVGAVAAVLSPTAASAADQVDRVLSDPRITESSGLALSARHPGVVYTHNDSGDAPRVFAVGRDGRTAAVLTIAGAQARDWEAIAPGRAGSGTFWVGDIGDNIDGWPSYAVYKVQEPSSLRSQTLPATKYVLTYPDGSHNAESLLVHPRTGRLYVVTKTLSGGALYEAPTTLSTTSPNVLRRIAPALEYATDAAFSPDGRHYVVRGYVDARVYATATPGKAIATVDLPAQAQGESIAWSADGRSFLVGSEGRSSPVYRVPVPAGVLGSVSTASPSPSTSATTPADVVGPSGGSDASSTGGLARRQVLWLGAGALVLIALGFSLRAWGRADPSGDDPSGR